jgi:predicted GH43/DUF377 family glycosyl hydrolase
MSTQFHRYRTYHNNVIRRAFAPTKSGLPSVFDQAYDIGGTFTKISSGLPENSFANFSPCVTRHRGATLIAWRSQPEHFVFRHDMKYFYYNNTPTDIWIGQLLSDDTIVAPRKLIDKKHRLSYEDPRIFVSPDDNLMCQFVTSTYATKWDTTNHKMIKTPKICTGAINEFGQLVDRFYPPIGDNFEDGKSEKNWCFFSHDNYLHLLYSTQPLVVKTPNKADKVIDSICLKQVTSEHPTFNSTAPVLVDDEWLVFYHWKFMAKEADHRPYLMYALGAYTLDKELTKITRMMKEPLFVGSTNDDLVTWTNAVGGDISNQPACILPFGCFVDESDDLVMSLGVNDYYMGIFRTPVLNVLSLMEPVK